MSLVLWACSGGDASPSVEVPEDRLALPEAHARGEKVYRARCALCHGLRADGVGARRAGLSGKPANFRSKAWRANAEPSRLFSVLENGVPGTSMPAWPVLSATDKWDVIAYILAVAGEGP